MLPYLRMVIPIALPLTVAVVAVSAATLQQEPPAGSLSSGQTVLVDDGSCPAGQIKQITGGGSNAGQPRQRKCVDRIADQTGRTTQDISHDSGQHPVAGVALETPWGEPDLEGIWTDEFDTPFQRPAKYAGKEFFTEAQRAELDKKRAALLPRLGSPGILLSIKHTGPRTSRVFDPPSGRIPPLTAEAQKAATADRQFRLALLQATDACETKAVECRGGKYDPIPSPRRAEAPPRYNTENINRYDGPEDGSLRNRCLAPGLPDFGTAFGGGFRRIVQTPGGISMFYDVGEGEAWQRNIVMDGRPHLPQSIRQWYGDSRGHWEGATLVIDVTNFSPKSLFKGSRENLHLIERWTRTGPKTLEYEVTIEDPTTWTRAWTVKQEFAKQSDQENRIYYEPRCLEGNYSLPSTMLAARKAELAFGEGRGPNPATINNVVDVGEASILSIAEEVIWDP
jgi:hypothetical protein